MPACRPILFHDFLPAAAGRGVHALDSHSVRMALVTAVPSMQTAALLTDVAQVATGNGYPAGGVQVTVTQPTQVGGIFRFVVGAIPVITGTGAGFTHIGAVFYNNTAAGKNLICAVYQSGNGQMPITNVAQSGLVATLTAVNHQFSNGDTVVIDGVPFSRLNGTFTVSGVTANTFNINSPVSASIASQASTGGLVIKPETVNTGTGLTYTVTTDQANGLLVVAPKGLA